MKDRYILATDTFDSKVFSVCVFDRQNDLVIISENIFGEKEFEERVNQLSKHYNCSRIEEYEIQEETKIEFKEYICKDEKCLKTHSI